MTPYRPLFSLVLLSTAAALGLTACAGGARPLTSTARTSSTATAALSLASRSTAPASGSSTTTSGTSPTVPTPSPASNVTTRTAGPSSLSTPSSTTGTQPASRAGVGGQSLSARTGGGSSSSSMATITMGSIPPITSKAIHQAGAVLPIGLGVSPAVYAQRKAAALHSKAAPTSVGLPSPEPAQLGGTVPVGQAETGGQSGLSAQGGSGYGYRVTTTTMRSTPPITPSTNPRVGMPPMQPPITGLYGQAGG